MQGRSSSAVGGRNAIACFVSSHGFGHAARAAAILSALHKQTANCRFDIYTTVPDWFFADSLECPYSRIPMETDVGLVQKSPLTEDLAATADRLDGWYPLANDRVASLAGTLTERGTRLVICDIAPLGIAAARKAGIPSVLVENFTWDWIYAGYADFQHRLARHVDYLAGLFGQADFRIRARPACDAAPADLTVDPVSRPPRTDRETVRRRLGISGDQTLVLVSLGGTPLGTRTLGLGRIPAGTRVVVPANGDGPADAPGLLTVAPHGFYHPDLIGACDLVIGKTGYSTLAEVFHAGVAFGYVGRAAFRESAVLETFARKAMGARALAPETLQSGTWVDRIAELSASRRTGPSAANGAEAAADFIRSRL